MAMLITCSLTSPDKDVTHTADLANSLDSNAGINSTDKFGSPQSFLMWVKANAPSIPETPPVAGRPFYEEDDTTSAFSPRHRRRKMKFSPNDAVVRPTTDPIREITDKMNQAVLSPSKSSYHTDDCVREKSPIKPRPLFQSPPRCQPFSDTRPTNGYKQSGLRIELESLSAPHRKEPGLLSPICLIDEPLTQKSHLNPGCLFPETTDKDLYGTPPMSTQSPPRNGLGSSQ
ncbi:hypothetical protein FRC19_002927 [Serendipita sp. 401]|nr:hypothetical protein FRC19_002927 [Serendipita sp. 401]